MTFPSQQRPYVPYVPGPPERQPAPPSSWQPGPPQYQPPPPERPGRTALVAVTLAVVILGLAGAAFAVYMVSRPAAPAANATTNGQPPAAEEQPAVPPAPDAATRTAYIADLEAIDPDIVHGDPDTAVNRGRNLCQAMRGKPMDQWVTPAAQRFTSPTHPDGFGQYITSRIVGVVFTRLCPNY